MSAVTGAEMRLGDPAAWAASREIREASRRITAGDIDDQVNIAMQAAVGQFRLEGADPVMILLGIASGLGSVLALTGLPDIDGFAEIFWPRVEETFASSRDQLGRLGTEGRA